MKIFDFIYYCFYSLVKKRIADSSPKRASFLLSTTFSIYIVAIYFFSTAYFKLSVPDKKIYFIVGILMFVINGLLISNYFVTKQRYLQIVQQYSNLNKEVQKKYAAIAMILIISSYIFFGVSGMFLGKYIRPY
jgi:hypothetical protein